MEVVKIGYEDKGYRILGAASSKKAAQGLESSTGIESFTIAKLLKNIKSGDIKLDQKSCLVIDEAGQVSAGDMSRLMSHCVASGAKIVLTGEDKQIDAVQHGGSLRVLSRDDVVGTARIETIQRQNEAWAREAIANYRDGKMEAGFAAYESRGLIIMKDGGIDATLDALVERWKSNEQEMIATHKANPNSKMKESLIITHSNVSAKEVGDRVREFRKQQGIVSGPEYTIACAHGDRKFNLTLSKGDRIRFNKNDERDVGVINGTSGTILSVKEIPGPKKGKPDYLFKVMTDDRGEVEFKASEYSDEKGRLLLGQAYACTIYSSQGMTVDGNVFALQTAGMGRSNTYVACSRAKSDTYSFVDKEALIQTAKSNDPAKLRAALIDSMAVDRTRKMAVEYLADMNPNYFPETLKHYEFDSGRIERFAAKSQKWIGDNSTREIFRLKAATKREKRGVLQISFEKSEEMPIVIAVTTAHGTTNRHSPRPT